MFTDGEFGFSVNEGISRLVFRNSVVTDVDSPDLDGGVLTLSFSGGVVDTTDRIFIAPSGANISFLGSDILENGLVVGSFSGGTNGNPLQVALTSNATVGTVEAILDGVSFGNDTDNPLPGLRELEAVLTDGDGGTSNVARGDVTVNPLNDAPTAADNTVTIPEDGFYAFTAADFGFSDVDSGDTLQSVQITLPSNGVLTVDGTVQSAGSIITRADIDAGLFRYEGAPDFAGTDSFDFTVNDGTADSVSSYTINVDVIPLNDAPIVTGGTFNISEDAANFAVVGSASVTDPDVGDAHTFAITGGTGQGIFSITSTGQIVLTNNTPLDFETTQSYTLDVSATDTSALSDTTTLIVNVTDVNDTAPVVTPAQVFTISEDAANGSTVGTAIATDADTVGTIQDLSLIHI